FHAYTHLYFVSLHVRHVCACYCSTYKLTLCLVVLLGFGLCDFIRHPSSSCYVLLIFIVCLLLFFLIIPPPPRSTLFPYTTLFRSISGDALFNRGIGRTDLPGGSFAQLEKSLKEGLYELPDEFTVFPGHGPKTTIGDEKMLNPFVSAR